MLELYPIAIIEDRYGGVYSGGQWVAVANAGDTLGVTIPGRRIDMVLDEANGSDNAAREFWDAPPKWVAVGETPGKARRNLIRQEMLSAAVSRLIEHRKILRP